MPKIEIAPQPGPQTEFLSSPADIAGFGGGAGGGKSWAAMLDPLRGVRYPGFACVIFRKQLEEIKQAGGLWDKSFELYPRAGGSPNHGKLEWRWPSGAVIKFDSLNTPGAVYSFQGAELTVLIMDEATHQDEYDFWYLLSRLRTTCPIKPYARLTMNPDPRSWCKKLFAPWVDRSFPDPAEDGELRWMVRKNNEIVWVPEGTPKALSVTFVKSLVYDNKILLKANPEYLDNLENLNRVERARLLEGDWDVVNEGARFPFLDAREHTFDPERVWPDGEPPLHWRRIVSCDWGTRAPYCALWTAFDEDGHPWTYRERYLTGLTAWEQAVDILEHTRYGEQIDEVRCDPAMWSRPPNYTGASERQVVEDYAVVLGKDSHRRFGPVLRGHNKSRTQNLNTLERLLKRGNDWRDWRVSIKCPNLWRELTSAMYDPRGNSEDLDPKCDDHAISAAYYGLHTWFEHKGRKMKLYDPLDEPADVRQARARAQEYRRILRESDGGEEERIRIEDRI